MTDSTTGSNPPDWREGDTTTTPLSTADTGTGYGTGATSGTASAGTAGEGSESGGREWVGQLQGMIDNLATQAAPLLREIGAKAAELAALAGEKAGPIAHKAAGATEAAGHKLAERGREVASDLRRGDSGTGEGAAAGDAPNSIDPGSTTTATAYPADTSRTVGE